MRFVFESKSDVFVNLPTGFGKSVVFQALPIVYSCVDQSREKNIVLVVSLLINLMKEQVSRLNSRKISAISTIDISSELEIRAVENEVISPACRRKGTNSSPRSGRDALGWIVVYICISEL